MKKNKQEPPYQKTFGVSDRIVFAYEDFYGKVTELYGMITGITHDSEDASKYQINVTTHGTDLPEKYPADIALAVDSLLPDADLYYPQPGRFYIGQKVNAVSQKFNGGAAVCLIENVKKGFLNFGRNKYTYTVYCIDDNFHGVSTDVSYDRISVAKEF